MKVHGQCHCGFVAFEAEGDPERTTVCHCTDCQAMSGAPFRAVVPAEAGTFKLLSGAPAEYVKTAESGNKRIQAFCPKCGSPVYATSVGDGPKIYNMRVGALRERGRFSPRRQIWTRSRQDWVNHLSVVQSAEKQ
jgi:hypothetical protein